MINRKNIGFWLVIVLLSLPLLYLLITIGRIDYADDFPIPEGCVQPAPLSLVLRVEDAQNADSLTRMPLDSFAFCDAAALERSLNQMNSFDPAGKDAHVDLLLDALTVQLEEKVVQRMDAYDPNALYLLLTWVNGFGQGPYLNESSQMVQEITVDHWMNFLSNRLGAYYNEHPDRKFDFKFRYLVTACRAKRYFPPISNSNTEKVVQYLTEQKFAYLWNRFWNSAPPVLFYGLLFLGGFVLFCCLYTPYHLIQSISKSNHT